MEGEMHEPLEKVLFNNIYVDSMNLDTGIMFWLEKYALNTSETFSYTCFFPLMVAIIHLEYNYMYQFYMYCDKYVKLENNAICSYAKLQIYPLTALNIAVCEYNKLNMLLGYTRIVLDFCVHAFNQFTAGLPVRMLHCATQPTCNIVFESVTDEMNLTKKVYQEHTAFVQN